MRSKGIGSASFILIALLLSLTCFGLLAFYSAKNEADSLQESIEAIQAYEEAQQKMAILLQQHNESPSEKTQIDIELKDGRILHSQLKEEDGHWVIEKQTIQSQQEGSSDTIEVWDGKE